MSRRPLYQAENLTLFFDQNKEVYILRKNNSIIGRNYETIRQVKNLLSTLEKDLDNDTRFKNTTLKIDPSAKIKLS